ncbi:unnamed protein product [Brassicogethes aeneus]|uniref:Uncharacterized protein n=1 Tax=Brassicogethes aeneus TaxID=1431903 RepID=A0A9P0BK51_BRAAE|nr:unnamed protein product [Brassicogethes aeneus]
MNIKYLIFKMSSTTIFIVALLAGSTFGKEVIVQNKGKVGLTVSVSGLSGIQLPPKGKSILDLPENWQGKISGCSELCDGPKTVADLTLSPTLDQYDVSLSNGFNIPIKVIPVHGGKCKAAVCASRKINKICPLESQVKNTLGEVVACKNNPLIEAICPKARIMECKAESIRVILG